jgi:hypothetical protein
VDKAGARKERPRVLVQRDGQHPVGVVEGILDPVAVVDVDVDVGHPQPLLEHRQDLAEIAKISNEMIKLDARRTELQDAIGKRNKVYLAAEEALGAHLATKHRVVAPEPEKPASGDPEPVMARKPRPTGDHAANCAVYFGDPCDCA